MLIWQVDFVEKGNTSENVAYTRVRVLAENIDEALKIARKLEPADYLEVSKVKSLFTVDSVQ